MSKGSDVRDHLNLFFDIVDKLRDLEVEINADLLAIMLLYSLPSSFQNFRCAIKFRNGLPTPEILRIKVIQEYDVRKNESREYFERAMFAIKKQHGWKRHPTLKRRNFKNTFRNTFEEVGFLSDEAKCVELNTGNKRRCLNNGATFHLSNEIKDFRVLENDHSGRLNLMNNSFTSMQGRGTDVFGERKGIKLMDALYVPDL
ncbi:hypothetical protein Trydic_g1809 [Trypoxylus dichotomus]